MASPQAPAAARDRPRARRAARTAGPGGRSVTNVDAACGRTLHRSAHRLRSAPQARLDPGQPCNAMRAPPPPRLIQVRSARGMAAQTSLREDAVPSEARGVDDEDAAPPPCAIPCP